MINIILRAFEIIIWLYSLYNMTFVLVIEEQGPIPVDARSKSWDYGHSLAGIAASNPAWSMGVCLLWVLCVVR
jgi:hypothetical protein